MKKSQDYFLGAATVTARFTYKLKGQRRTDAVAKATRGVCPHGITWDGFEKLVAASETRIRAR